MRRPSLSQMFGLGKIPGICEWLEARRNLLTSIYHLEGPDFWILASRQSLRAMRWNSCNQETVRDDGSVDRMV